MTAVSLPSAAILAAARLSDGSYQCSTAGLLSPTHARALLDALDIQRQEAQAAELAQLTARLRGIDALRAEVARLDALYPALARWKQGKRP